LAHIISSSMDFLQSSVYAYSVLAIWGDWSPKRPPGNRFFDLRSPTHWPCSRDLWSPKFQTLENHTFTAV